MVWPPPAGNVGGVAVKLVIAGGANDATVTVTSLVEVPPAFVAVNR
jgi:hypothetical protein